MFVLYNSYSIPYELAFQIGDSDIINGINWAVDSLFLIDIFVGFRTSYMNKDGKEVLSGSMIAKNYIQNSFLIDFIATIPIDFLARELFDNDDPKLQLFGVLKMGRLARLERIIRMLNSTQTIKVIAQLSYIVIGILIYLHWYCCIFWVIVRDDATWLPYYLSEDPGTSLRFLYQDTHASQFSKYLCVFYQAVVCMGGGDINPQGMLAIFYSGFGVVLASYINANIFGQL